MKKFIYLTLTILITFQSFGQNSALEVEQYTLSNGLTIMLNSDPNASQVYGAMVVKAGSKNDPHDATGIAHYLEHLLFKGTDKMGTANFELEKPHLDSITLLYDQLGKTQDETERENIRKQINEQSVKASKHGLPNEFDNLLKGIGSTGVNAFTSADMTVYHNSFPPEQMDKWMQLYSERFRNPIFRSFQSELEVVYEEKNRAMDGVDRKLFELLNANLFKNHPYGTQTTLGTVEHLKNPSLSKMYDFFNTYYVANNMGLILCGNFNIEEVKPLIKKHFSSMRQGVIPKAPEYEKTVFSKNEIMTIKSTPIKLELLGCRGIPEVHEDRAAIDVLVSLLVNQSETGYLDKLSLDRKVLAAELFELSYKEDGALILIIVPKLIGQSFGEAEKLVLGEISKLKEGIAEEALEIVKTELYRQHETSIENYRYRTYWLMDAFSNNTTWDYQLKYSERINAVTEKDVIRVLEKYLLQPYFTLRSKRGTPEKTVLEKPGFEPVIPDGETVSDYAKAFKEIKILPLKPRFIDLENDAEIVDLNESNRLYAVKNPMNEIFNLRVEFEVGTDSIKGLDMASDLFRYMHVEGMTLDELKKEFAKLGLTAYAYENRNAFTVSFQGIEKNLEASIVLINKLLYTSEASEDKKKIVLDNVKANKKFEKKDPSTVGDALYEYVIYGQRSSYINRRSKKDVKKTTVDEMVNAYKKATEYNGVWHFSGKASGEEVAVLMKKHLRLANSKKRTLPNSIPKAQPTKTIVYITHDKKAVQSQINFFVPSEVVPYTKQNKTKIGAFNEYIGGGFSGIILQEVREYRSLAYSAWGSMWTSPIPNYRTSFRSYIGCQADKTNEAIDVMISILDSMPEKPERMETIQSGLKNKAAAKYPSFRWLSYYVAYANTYGKDVIFNPQEYELYDSLTFDDITTVYQTYVQDRPTVITISGNKKKFDMEKLAELGEIVYVKKKKLFR